MTNPINANTTVMTNTVPSALGRVTDRSLLNDQGSANVPASPAFRDIPSHILTFNNLSIVVPIIMGGWGVPYCARLLTEANTA
jgi:hypothetical protein